MRTERGEGILAGHVSQKQSSMLAENPGMIFKRGHSVLISLQSVYGDGPAGVCPGLTSCDPGPELQSQEKTWYLWPV